MPLQDHFHPPLSKSLPWTAFHSRWATEIADELNRSLLPPRYRAWANVQLIKGVNRLRLETDIRKGLDLQEFKVHYQPLVSLASGRITGFEALSRWQRPTGMVPPLEFITIADETGLILPMNRQLMQESAMQDNSGFASGLMAGLAVLLLSPAATSGEEIPTRAFQDWNYYNNSYVNNQACT